MKLTAIVAMTPERVIGRDGTLPWHLSEDLKFFKRTTIHHAVIMGRKTFESIGKALPKRQNFVLTHDQSWSAKDVEVLHSPGQLAESARHLLDVRVFVIGGAAIYEAFLPDCDDLLVSWIYESYQGDTRFPEFEDQFPRYEVLEQHPEFEVRHYRREPASSQGPPHQV